EPLRSRRPPPRPAARTRRSAGVGQLLLRVRGTLARRRLHRRGGDRDPAADGGAVRRAQATRLLRPRLEAVPPGVEAGRRPATAASITDLTGNWWKSYRMARCRGCGEDIRYSFPGPKDEVETKVQVDADKALLEKAERGAWYRFSEYWYQVYFCENASRYGFA